MTKELTPFGYNISKDHNERVSLTDLWKASGSNPQNTPAKWQETESAKVFIEATGQILNIAKNDIIESKRGKGGGTFAHKQIALAYAKYLSPELHYFVNNAFFERIEEEKKPELAIERAMKTWSRHGKSDKWIQERIMGVATRKHFTSTLSAHGVSGIGYKNCTNAIYKPLWGGGANVVRAKKGLPVKTNTRENMTDIELASVRLAELLSANNIEQMKIAGNEACEKECLRSSSLIANAVSQSIKKFA